jgi:hypothetical protein
MIAHPQPPRLWIVKSAMVMAPTQAKKPTTS